MAIIFPDSNRNVIPNWRSFKVTSTLGELDSGTSNETFSFDFNLFNEQMEDWQLNKSIGFAADLVSSAIVLGVSDRPEVIDAANYILNNRNKSNSVLNSLVTSHINENHKVDIKSLNANSLETFQAVDKLKFYLKVNKIKQKLWDNPRNAILWVELSRQYSILGQLEKAHTAMSNAFILANNNRFVLRSFARLQIHLHDIDKAHDILRKTPNLLKDPWLLASEIALASMRDRSSRHFKTGIEILKSKNFSPFDTSELASALATVELQAGSHKKSRELFKSSLIQPNDNALAQVEWAATKDNLIKIGDPINFGLETSFEALALDQIQNKNWEEVISNSIKWFFDMPFSKKPITIGSHISSVFLDDDEQAIAFLHAGLISHPNDLEILNHIIYSFCLMNRLSEAEKHIPKADFLYEDNSEASNIAYTATKGLYFFRKGFSDAGRKKYDEALRRAGMLEDKYLFSLAFINLTREEILAKTENAKDIVSKMDVYITSNSPDIIAMKDKVLRLYKEVSPV